jgi:hypothetical protein
VIGEQHERVVDDAREVVAEPERAGHDHGDAAGGLAVGSDIRGGLARARAAAWEWLPRLGDALDAADGMDALRAALAHLRATGDDGVDALAAIGAAPVFVAAWSRKRAGRRRSPRTRCSGMPLIICA